jgi:hypothetical protein
MTTPGQQEQNHATAPHADTSLDLEMFTTILNSKLGKKMTPVEIREAIVAFRVRKA